jgi:hypothetical protein
LLANGEGALGVAVATDGAFLVVKRMDDGLVLAAGTAPYESRAGAGA